MTLPKPSKITEELQDLRATTHRIADEYGWAYTLAFSAARVDPATEDAKVRRLEAVDPTGNAVSDEVKEAIRSKLGQVAGKVRHIGEVLREAEDLLGSIFARGPRDSIGNRPRIVTAEELAEAHRAQERRRARGESWGEA